MDDGSTGGADLIEAHKAVKKRLRLLRIIFPLIIILIVVLNIYALVNQVQSLDAEEVAAGLEAEAHKLWPRLEDDLALVAKTLRPVLQAEITKQSAAMGPKLERRLKADVEKTKVTVEKDFHKAVERALDEIERRQRNVLVEHIPQLKDDKKAQDRVLEAVRVAVTKWMMKQLTTTLHEHMVAMDDMFKTLQKSYTAPLGAKVGAEDALLVWLDLMNEQVGGDNTILAPAPETKGKKKKAKKKATKKAGKGK